MTEDQANLTRCCGPEGCGGNSSNGPDRYCLASRCMGWRTVLRSETIHGDTAVDVHTAHHVDGFCGLAGKP